MRGFGNIDVDLTFGGIDFTGGVTDDLSSIIGVIAGLVTGVVAWVVTPIILTIVLKIVAAISLTLAWALFGILVSNPAGWVILAGIGIGALAVGGVAADEAKRKIQEKIPDWDLPKWVRGMVKRDSIHQQIDNNRGEISKKVAAALEEKKDLSEKIINALTQAFKENLRTKAENARLFIN